MEVTTYAFVVDPLDHAETPLVAYQHIAPILAAISVKLGKKPSQLVIYDPYYCQGTVSKHLSELGYTSVINRNVDFYSEPLDASEFDVLVTNPPYSSDHPQKLIEFVESTGKPYLILAPNWLYMKPYVRAIERSLYIVAPKKRYIYTPPDGLKRKTSPFVSLWFVRGPRVSEMSEEVLICATSKDLPMTFMDQYDPEYKRLRNIEKSKKRKRGGDANEQKVKSWGHKAGVKR